MDKKIEGLKLILKEELNPQRYEHSLRVMETSEKLAKINNIDINKARIAGLLHDCGKYDSMDKILQEVKNFGIILDDITQENKGIIHGELGYFIAREKYGVRDEEVLNAIKYHTVGRKDMTSLEKIVYLADMIEPKRNFPEVEEIREKTFKDLDNGLLFALDHSIIFLISKGVLIHTNTIDARNSLLLKKTYNWR